MKRLTFLVLFVILASLTVSAQQAGANHQEKGSKNVAVKSELTRVFWTGDRGEFEYPWNSGNDFVVWHAGEGGSKSGVVSATITSDTKITVKNRKGIDKSNLDLLSGKRVSVLALIKEVGRGEGSKQTCKELEIVMESDN